jgi:Flp pilus assembly pilin Flp
MELKKYPAPVRGESGQAAVEYILILSVIVSFYMALLTVIDKADLGTKLAGPVVGTFAMTYKYGNPKAKGLDEGTPVNHPRMVIDGKVRLFINPR